jgi:hypothetical protein
VGNTPTAPFAKLALFIGSLEVTRGTKASPIVLARRFLSWQTVLWLAKFLTPCRILSGNWHSRGSDDMACHQK